MPDVVIDTCCLINLCAVGDLASWLPSIGFVCHVPSAVRGEALFLCREDNRGEVVRERINIASLLGAGLFDEVEPGATERDLYVELAVNLDDGEAMAIAIAKCRKWLLATDDRKAVRFAKEIGVAVISTPKILKMSADARSLPRDQVREALLRVERHAKFCPSAGTPLADWWHSHTGRRR